MFWYLYCSDEIYQICDLCMSLGVLGESYGGERYDRADKMAQRALWNTT